MDADAKQAIADRWAALAQAKDFETWSSFWHEDMRIMEPGMDMDLDAFLEFGKGFFGSGGKVISLEVETFDLFEHGDIAYQTGQYIEDYQPPNKDPIHVENNFFARWVKAPDGTWKMSRFVASPKQGPEEG